MSSKITYFFEYFKFLKNPINCLLFKFGFKKSVTVKFKDNNNELHLTKVKSINNLMNFIRNNEYHVGFGEYIKNLESSAETFQIITGIEIYSPNIYPFNSVFTEYFTDYYSDFGIDFKDRVIIDIGAHAGDSALYFALNGASVYGFEPVKECYDVALKNIGLNPHLKDNIEIYNYGVSYKSGKLNIESMESTSSYVSENNSYEVKIISIEDILKHVSPDLLKMDCEGCEFEIIENCDLSMFNEIIFEHHSEMVGKDYNILIKRLKEQGFKIKFSSVFCKNISELALVHAYK